MHLGLSGENSGAGQKPAMLVHVVVLVDNNIEEGAERGVRSYGTSLEDGFRITE